MSKHVTYNVVLVRHPNNPGLFVFKVSEDVELPIGKIVLCDTRRGSNEIGTCVTPSFEIADFQLEKFWNVKPENLKPVTAYLNPVVIPYQKEE